jgi:hypothetical protein
MVWPAIHYLLIVPGISDNSNKRGALPDASA